MSNHCFLLVAHPDFYTSTVKIQFTDVTYLVTINVPQLSTSKIIKIHYSIKCETPINITFYTKYICHPVLVSFPPGHCTVPLKVCVKDCLCGFYGNVQ